MLKRCLKSYRIETIAILVVIFLVLTSLVHSINYVEEKHLTVEKQIDLFIETLSKSAKKRLHGGEYPGDSPTIELDIPIQENALKDKEKLRQMTEKYVRFLGIFVKDKANEMRSLEFRYSLNNIRHVSSTWFSSLGVMSSQDYANKFVKTLDDSLTLFVEALSKEVTYDYKSKPDTLILTIKNFRTNEFSVYGSHFLDYSDAVARLGYVFFMREQSRFKTIGIKCIKTSPIDIRGPLIYFYPLDNVLFSELKK